MNYLFKLIHYDKKFLLKTNCGVSKRIIIFGLDTYSTVMITRVLFNVLFNVVNVFTMINTIDFRFERPLERSVTLPDFELVRF